MARRALFILFIGILVTIFLACGKDKKKQTRDASTGKSGAEMVLLSSECRTLATKLAEKIEYVEIAGDRQFQDVFTEYLGF